MQILFVSPYFPIPQRTGGRVRVFNILRELARTERVTLACHLSQESLPFVQEIEQWGVEVHTIPREIRQRPLARHLRFLPSPIPFSLVDPDRKMRELVENLWSKRRYDLVQVEFLAMGYVVERSIFEGRRFLTHHYSASDHYRRLLDILPKRSPRYWMQRVDSAKMTRYERRMLELFSRVFVTSEQDRRLLSTVSPLAQLVVSNNGVDAEFYKSGLATETSRHKVLVSTCSFLTDPNIDSVVWFLKKIWPRVLEREPAARYEIIGYNPPHAVHDAAARSQGVRVVGGVEDVRPHLDRAAASLITMRAGSGVKIRALTSLAMGCPIIATPLGAEGLRASECDGVFIGESPDSIASLAVRLLAEGVDSSIRQRARKYVELNHSWQKAADVMRQTYRGTLGR